MRFRAAAALLGFTASAFPTIFDTESAISTALDFAQSAFAANEYLEIEHSFFDETSGKHRKRCVLHPVKEGEGFDDDNLMKAVEQCGNGGIIRLPDAN